MLEFSANSPTPCRKNSTHLFGTQRILLIIIDAMGLWLFQTDIYVSSSNKCTLTLKSRYLYCFTITILTWGLNRGKDINYGTLYPADSPVKKAALCAGSGSSVLKGVEADLYLTGKRLRCFVIVIKIGTRRREKRGLSHCWRIWQELLVRTENQLLE